MHSTVRLDWKFTSARLLIAVKVPIKACLAENKQSVSELHANSEMQRNKRRNQINLLSCLLLVYPITKSQRFLSSNPQPILNLKATQSRGQSNRS
jgi:hypothetical protein